MISWTSVVLQATDATLICLKTRYRWIFLDTRQLKGG
jgi:hypothetical protein